MKLLLSGLKKKKRKGAHQNQRPLVCSSRCNDHSFTWESESRPGVGYRIKYTAMQGDKGRWSCTCPAYVYRKPMVNACKHIEALKEKVCVWKSTVGPEMQEESGKCPRCGKPTEEEGEAP